MPYHMGTSYECETPSQGLHAMVVQLMASIKGLSDAKNSLEIELTRLKEANVSLVARLNVVEKILEELQQKFADTEKSARSKMSANNHVILKSIIQPLFSQLCRIDCNARKKNCVAALAAVKPLNNQQPFELSSEATQIWHPNWLGKVDDNLNVKFLKESANLEVVLLDGVHWLKGFYSQMNEGNIFKVDANYLKELDQWLKSSDGTPESLGEEDDM
ncbi:hypothetical protein EDC04DRAFT_2891156 [Pisolithus marmoratus]|nr:hypothetical protein EDC04DRAFT_2891156 [Pisolithus marmoratus]